MLHRRDALVAVDRRARVARHSPTVRTFDAYSALSVGNGGFAFTVDATGLQTFAEEYRDIPLATQAEWAWHSFANPSGFRLDDAMALYDAHGRQVSYDSAQNSPAGKWLRENPHRLSLARVGFALTHPDGRSVRSSELADVRQRLDLWSGIIESTFVLDGRTVRVMTCAHPERDAIAVRVESTARREHCARSRAPRHPHCLSVRHRNAHRRPVRLFARRAASNGCRGARPTIRHVASHVGRRRILGTRVVERRRRAPRCRAQRVRHRARAGRVSPRLRRGVLRGST